MVKAGAHEFMTKPAVVKTTIANINRVMRFISNKNPPFSMINLGTKSKRKPKQFSHAEFAFSFGCKGPLRDRQMC